MKYISILLLIFFLIGQIKSIIAQEKKEITTEEEKPSEEKETTEAKEEKTPDYQIKLNEIEQKVTELKEKIFNSKTRILLLKEQILHSVIAEARAVIMHKNDMGTRFNLDQVLYHLNNNKIYFQENKDGVLDKNKEFEIFNGSVAPGNHLLTVEMVYSGNGAIFTYLSGYRFKIKSSYTFYASKGRLTKVKSIGYEKGGALSLMEESPSVKFEVQQIRLTKEVLEEKKGEETK